MTRALRKVSRCATICTYRTFTRRFIDSIMKGPFQNPVNSGRYCATGPRLRSSVLVSVRNIACVTYILENSRKPESPRSIARNYTPFSIFGRKTCEMLISPFALSPRDNLSQPNSAAPIFLRRKLYTYPLVRISWPCITSR